jgi:hypothetical protein
MKASTKFVSTIAIALIIAGAATGCVAVTTGLNELGKPVAVGHSAAPVETATPAPVVKAPLVGDLDGNGKISAFEQGLIDRSAPKAYTMPNGTVVQIDPTKPFPAEVTAVVAAAGVGPTSQFNGSDATVGTLIKYLNDQADATGKEIVAVFRSNGSEWEAAPSHLRNTSVMPLTSKGAMVAAVQAWADIHGYEVIVIG